MSDESIGVYVGEVSGREFSVWHSDFKFSANGVATDVDLGPYKTECGYELSQPDADGKLYCHELKEFLIKK